MFNTTFNNISVISWRLCNTKKYPWIQCDKYVWLLSLHFTPSH